MVNFRNAYGWTRIEGDGPEGEALYTENEKEQEVIRDLHNYRAMGWEIPSLATLMIARGAAPPKGKRWTPDVVKHMLERCKPGERPKLAQKKRKQGEIEIFWQPGMTIKEVTEQYRRQQLRTPDNSG